MGTRSGDIDINEGDNLENIKIKKRQAGRQGRQSARPCRPEARARVHVEIAKLAPSQPTSKRGRNHRPRKAVTVSSTVNAPSPAFFEISVRGKKVESAASCRKLPQGARGANMTIKAE